MISENIHSSNQVVSSGAFETLERGTFLQSEGELRKSYLFYRANYQHFFGKRQEQQTIAGFRRYQKAKQHNQHGIMADLNATLANHKIIDAQAAIDLSASQPVIFSSFHYGPYHLLGVHLSELGIEFSVLANGAVNMQSIRSHTISKINNNEHSNKVVTLDDSDIISPDGMSTMLACLEKLRAGRSLMVYGDGLEGQTSYYDRRKQQPIRFLNRELYARKGLATLAYKLKVPIIPVILYPTEDGGETRFFPAIMPEDYPSRDAFVQAYCQLGYSYLEPYVKENPDEWEIFDHLHLYVPTPGNVPDVIKPSLSPASIRFNAERFGVFKDQGINYLLDSNHLSIMSITRSVATLLPRLINAVPVPTLREVIPEKLFQELFSSQIIIPATIQSVQSQQPYE